MSWRRRLLFGSIIAMATVLLAEGVLQLAALLLGATASRSSLPGMSDELRILCLGDSNTFGLSVSAAESYPMQLESLWNDRGGRTVQVINLGYPGTNTSRVVADFGKAITEFQPDIVLVKIGVNDFYTARYEAETRDTNPLLGFLKRNSRLFGIYVIYASGRYDPAKLEVHEPAVPLREPVTVSKADGGAGADSASDDPAAALREVEIDGAISYGDTALIDFEKAFEEACVGQGACSELLMPDQHHTAKGYALVAELIVRELPEVLTQSAADPREAGGEVELLERAGESAGEPGAAR